MVHVRLAVLDYRIDLDYFARGLRKFDKRMKGSKSGPREYRTVASKHRRKGKGKDAKRERLESAPEASEAAARATPDAQDSSITPNIESRGARHGKAVAEHVNEGVLAKKSPLADAATPLLGPAETAESAGARHGKIIHQERTSDESTPTSSPMVNGMSKSDGVRGKGVEHGKAIHHDRNQSNVSSTVTGTTAVNLPSIDETQRSPEGIAYYSSPVTPSNSNASTSRARANTIAPAPINPTPALPPLENEMNQTRASKLGRAIQSTAGQSWIPTSKGKLRVTNGIREEELLTTPRSTPTPSSTPEEQSQPSSTPHEFRRKRSTERPLAAVAKENKTAKHDGVTPSIDDRVLVDDGEPGPSSFIPKPLSIKRSGSVMTQAAGPRKHHEARVSPKVGKQRLPVL